TGPVGAARFIDPCGGIKSVIGKAGTTRQVEMLAVVLVRQIVDTRAELEVLVQAIRTIDRQYAEAGTFVKVLADHGPLILGHSSLRRGYPPQSTGAPVVALVGQAKAPFQGRNLRHGAIIAAVLAPGVGQTRLGLPVASKTVACARFRTGNGRIDVADLGSEHGRHYPRHIAEQDVILHQPGIGRNPGFQRPFGILQTDVQLGGLLGPYRVKWLQGTDRPRIGDEELPVIGEALGMTETCVPGGRQANEFFLVTHKAAVERVAPSFTGGWVIPILTDRHAHGIRQRWMVAVEELALVSRFVKIKA